MPLLITCKKSEITKTADFLWSVHFSHLWNGGVGREPPEVSRIAAPAPVSAVRVAPVDQGRTPSVGVSPVGRQPVLELLGGLVGAIQVTIVQLVELEITRKSKVKCVP